MKYICPLLVVDNIERSRYFYENILQQNVKNDYGENIVFEAGFAIHLKSHFKKLIHERKIISKNHHVELYFETNELEKLVKKLTDNNIEFIHSIEMQPWGQKVIRFYDPDGNLIEAGEPIASADQNTEIK